MQTQRCVLSFGLRHAACLLALLVATLLAPLNAGAASMNRFLLASQNDFGAKRGFYVDFENEAPDGQICRLSSLKLYFAVANGTEWRFPAYVPPGGGWLYDHDYSVRAEIGAEPGGGATLYLDGKKVAEASDAHLAPFAGPLTAGERPAWASGPAEYVIRQTALQLQPGKSTPVSVPFPTLAERPLPVYLFEPNTPVRPLPLTLSPGEPLIITANFRLERFPTDLHPFAPLVDEFGQSRHAHWAGKIATDADLQRARADEARRNAAWGAAKKRDAFGGDLAAPWRETPTGFYRTLRRDGRWWLISPDGNPTFYTGLCTAPAIAWDRTPASGREFLFAGLPPHIPPTDTSTPNVWSQNVWGSDPGVDYVNLHSANMIRKYGPDWAARSQQSLQERLNTWGFSGMAKWCDPVGALPRMPVLNVSGSDVPRIARHIDVFDPVVRGAFATKLRAQIEPRKSDPTILGWSYGNEYDEVINGDEVRDILRQHPDSSAARALRDYALTKIYAGDATRLATAWPGGVPGEADTEALRRFYADRYYDLLYATVKSVDPNHLYFGFWIVPGWWVSEEDWRLIAPHCDVIGYDRYAPTFADDRLTRLARETDKPIFCGEFSFPPWYDGLRGFGRFADSSVATDAEAGDAYARWVGDAAKNPFCIGVSWFQYGDEPITGRGPGHGDALVYGEHYAFGLVDVTDTPKWDLVSRVRDANLRATDQRLQAGKTFAKTATTSLRQ